MNDQRQKSGKGGLTSLLKGLASNDRLYKLVWPVLALLLLMIFNYFFTASFFNISVRDGRLYGPLMSILNRGAPVMIVAMGMTLVIATGGIDLSVGAVMAMSGAVAARVINMPGMGAGTAIAAALTVSLLAGSWNAILVAGFRIQPIVATLILMVAGRGIAQLITGGQIITFVDPQLTAIGNDALFSLPITIWIAIGVLIFTVTVTRMTALGLFIEAVGGNETASRYAGIHVRGIKASTYLFTGLCAGIAGLIEASYIRGADANNAGLYLELDAIMAVVIGGTALVGGRYYLPGAFIGAILIRSLHQTLLLLNVNANIFPLPKAIVVILVCLLQSPEFRNQITAPFKRKTRGI